MLPPSSDFTAGMPSNVSLQAQYELNQANLVEELILVIQDPIVHGLSKDTLLVGK